MRGVNHQMLLIASLGWMISASSANAQLAEEILEQATSGDANHLFPVNPAYIQPKGAHLGGLLGRTTRTSTLDHSSNNGDKITTSVTEVVAGAAALIDLGAGAGLGISHVANFKEAETGLSGRRTSDNRVETYRRGHTTAKIAVELTESLRAAVSVRVLKHEATVYGDPFLQNGMATRYHTSMIGYGAGFAYVATTGGLGYAYYPPLHGKTDVQGEERMVAEPGAILADGHLKVSERLVLGLLGKRWLNEIDDLAAGTTASDDQTRISLLGLDPDQYVIRDQLVLFGGEYAINKQTLLKISLGQETDHFNFVDYMQYQRVDVRGAVRDKVQTSRLRAAIAFGSDASGVDFGIGLFRRRADFSEAANGGSYSLNDGREISATARLKF